MSEHKYYKCLCNKPNCQFCEGGLASCTVCNGGEGTLSTECCGYKLDEHVLNAIWMGALDFYNDTWQVKYCEHGKIAKGSEPKGVDCEDCWTNEIAQMPDKGW